MTNAPAAWKGGRHITTKGYVRVTTAPYERKLEHRIKMEEKLKRRLRRGEDVHHDNEVKSDNSLENLVVLTRSEHMRHHALKRHAQKRG